MRVVFELDDRRDVVAVDRWQPETTLGELINAVMRLDLPDEAVVYVDGTSTQAATRLEQVTLLEGTLISEKPLPAVASISGWCVSVAAGQQAGMTLPVPEHREVIVGRSPQADVPLTSPATSWVHCTLQREGNGVRIRDRGSTNGTVIAGEHVDAEEGALITSPTTVIVGGEALMIRPSLVETAAPTPGSQPNITPSATAPFNRPPRLGQRVQPDPLVPPAPQEVSQPTKFNVIASLAPIVMAVVLVMVLGSLRFALFALLTPVVAVATYIDSRHRYRKNLEEEEKRFSAALVEFGQEIERAGELETRHLLSVAPDPAVVLRRPRLPSVELWHRRYGDGKFLLLNAGIGDVPWTPRLEGEPNTRHDERVKHVLANARRIGAPVMVSLDDAGVVGIVGDRTHALGLARNLLTQVGVHCGPADVMMSVFCDDGVEHEWAWCSWLPHTRNAASSEGARWMSHDHQASVSMIRGLLDNVAGLPTPAMVMVIDSVKLTEGRDAPARDLLGYGRGAHPRPGEQPPRKVSGIVIAQSAEQLPAACTTVIDVDAEGSATVVYDDAVGEVPDVVVAGISSHDAGEAARRLAQFEDPELVIPGATLPSLIQLDELLGVEEMNAAAIEHLWDSTQGISAPVGMGESGPLHLDIVRDGPHGLVGGTTGSGKSEFLRSYVAGLAAQNDPTVLNFILIDFKGGAAFTACERLPHTIGTISNLDEQLADRALRALEAEMERRQRLFAQAGEDIDNLPAYWDTNPAEPLPRLLVVIDEFAMLAKDFPDVLASLVSVAAVGRTLGVHMILATQRPAGVVNDDILANTNLRVALRVQSREDSSNVIDVPHAASISRTQMGRAYVKLGQDEILPIQTALVTGHSQDEAAADIDFAHTTVFGAPIPTPHLSQPKSTDDNDLDVLIDAVVEANNNRGIAPPRQVWPEALGEKVSLNGYHASRAKTDDAYPQPDVGGVHQQVVEAVLVDEPDLQRQRPHGWDLSQGNLLLLGIPGSGCSTTLVSLGLSIASTLSPDEVDLVCLDMGRDLAPLSNLPHVAGFVGSGPSAQERRLRFFRFLHTELERRKTTPGNKRTMIVMVDGLAALRDEYQDYDGQHVLDSFYRVYAEGPSVGMYFAVSTTRAKAIPGPVDDVTTQKWVFRLADHYDYANFGIKGKDLPAAVPGRCVDAETLKQMHVATPEIPLNEAVAQARTRWASAQPKPDHIGQLPTQVSPEQVAHHAHITHHPMHLPVGIREDTLQPAVVEFYEGEHVLIAGPARSGKSSLLRGLIEVIRHQPDPPQVWGIYNQRSPLRDVHFDREVDNPIEMPALVAELQAESAPVFLFVDDAERVDDPDHSLTNLVTSTPWNVHIIAAGRADEFRSLYNHWTRPLRKSQCGVLLQPDSDFDGEILGVRLPRQTPVELIPGRGYACGGGQAVLMHALASHT